jgi:hypothetical protein
MQSLMHSWISWHEHDADEIQQVAESCIAEASKNLEKKGWAAESIKVIGALPYLSLVS